MRVVPGDCCHFLAFDKGLRARRSKARDHKEVKDMNKYEMTLVISSKIEEDARNAVLDKAKALIERFGGNITNIEDAGKKRLAYEIQKMNEAFYYFIQFEAQPTAPAEIESRIRIQDNVLRYLIVSIEQ